MTGSGISRSKPSLFMSLLSLLEAKHLWHGVLKENGWFHICLLRKHARSMQCFCKKCDVGLCELSELSELLLKVANVYEFVTC
jgi:hypothetical protein